MNSSWLADFHEKTYLNRYPIALRTRGGIGYKVGRDVVSNFVGHPVHYLDAGQWKPITLEHANGKFDGCLFGWNIGERAVTYKNKVLFKPNAIIFNGIAHLLYFTNMGNRMVADVPNIGTYEVFFTERGVREVFTIPAPLEGTLEFDVAHARKPAGLHKAARHITGTEISGDVYTLTKDMQYPLEIDPDYSGTTNDGHTEGVNATYATARSTATGNSSSTSSLTGQQISTTYRCYRTHYKFDTSGIPDTDTISQVNMKLVATSNSSTTDFDVVIVKQDWSGEDPISGAAEAAYDGCLAATPDVTWLNTSGLTSNTQYTSPDMDTSWVVKTGYTYYGVLSGEDINNSAPTNNEYILLALTDNATPGYRPILTVAHAASGWSNIGKVNGIASASIAKVDGVAVASISKVNGVAV